MAPGHARHAQRALRREAQPSSGLTCAAASSSALLGVFSPLSASSCAAAAGQYPFIMYSEVD